MKKLVSIEDIKDFINNNTLSLLYFSSKLEKCSVCHMLLPKIQHNLKNYSNLQIATVDASEVKEVAGEFYVFSLPLIIFYVEGNEVLREGRFIRMNDLKEVIDKHYNLIFNP
ncbi:thioredoxin family protein [Clostridium botulinum C]|uniref:Thioredoxin family protein n=3 Tax=Clostridium botulinum TaxID=1491 RepID=A0A9Q4XV36_CLOBO|nr:MULTISPECIES: thioredoxin family protein [Clostridium]EGO86827.1 thioredoxin [Clostridium botulinum C str. Stockholm]AYF54692.1 thioredoxin [Clostridium novyi]EES90965.1 thioredoxin [Clostridium botulinum D str. 1873]MBO3442229.1 thioredoxin family protein [Clostridium haemolyticum]MCD3194465.1 thioredoxin family protein [Clostridium botulinum C]